jgi:hypothetical protein
MTAQQIKQAAAETISFRRVAGKDRLAVVSFKNGMPDRGVYLNRVLADALEVTSTCGGVYEIEIARISSLAA